MKLPGKNELRALVRLTRYKEYLAFVVVTSLLGAAAGNGVFGLKLLAVLLANWLAVGFSFMINDVEDARDDALNPKKAMRNPVSAGMMSEKDGTKAAFAVALMAGAIYLTLGFAAALTGWICLGTGFLYSWKKIRLKSIPVLDILSHGFMLAGLQFLAAVYAFSPERVSGWWTLLIFVSAISMYGQMFNEVRDYECDLKAGVTHTASVIGKRAATLVMGIFLAGGVLAGGHAILIRRFFPMWVMGLMGLIVVLFLIRPVWKMRKEMNIVELQQPMQKPIEWAAALSLGTWFVWPWLVKFF